MGRELKRVPLDFDWPTGVPWVGYVNPYPGKKCHTCRGDSLSPEGRDLWYGFRFQGEPLSEDEAQALIKLGRPWDLLAVNPNPTPEEIRVWSLGRGHDTINSWAILEARATRLGIILGCQDCEGGGLVWPDTGQKALHDQWIPYEPPSGEGYQLWMCRTGTWPLSPVFPTLEELSCWCAPNATTFAEFRATAEEWTRMLRANSVCHQEGLMIYL